jgi:hypothetical protein
MTPNTRKQAENRENNRRITGKITGEITGEIVLFFAINVPKSLGKSGSMNFESVLIE